MLFDIQFLNDFASVNSKERQFGEELYSSEVNLNISNKHFTLAWFTYACGILALPLFAAVDAYILSL
jgi:hypothetical protein